MSKGMVVVSQVVAFAAVAALATVAGAAAGGAAKAVAAQAVQVGAEAPGLAIDGEIVPVSVVAIGDSPIARLELWVEGAQVGSFEPDQPAPSLSVTFHWETPAPGWFTIEAKAFDANGKSGTSPPVQVQVVPPAGMTHVVPGPIGQTATEVAAAMAVPLDQLLAADPGIGPDEPYDPGSVVFLPTLPSGEPPPPHDDTGETAIEDGALWVGKPVDGVFLYLTQGGKSVRVPDDPSELLPYDGESIDLGPHLPPLGGDSVDIEVWGRSGEVELLAELVVSVGTLTEPATDLHALLDVFFLEQPLPTKSINATTKDVVDLEWASNVAHDRVAWFLSTYKPNPVTALNPTGVLQSGQAKAQGLTGSFSIDLSKNVVPTTPSVSAGGAGASVILFPGVGSGPATPARSFPQLDPIGSTWAWVVPVDAAGNPVGPPSPPVRMVVSPAPYDPVDAPPFDVISVKLELPPAANPALANCIRILSEFPPFPAGIGGGYYLNADGSTVPKGFGGLKITGTLPYPMGSDGVAIYPFTACPGETGNFSWGDVGCGFDPLCHVSKGLGELGEAAVEFGKFLVGLAGKAADAYNELKGWVIDQVASTLCPDAVSGPCKTMIQVGVDVLLTTVGVPPTLPEFDDLANLAKGELVDLALDQLGVGEACDALATAGTGKTCGELATQLENMDACSLAPKGQEDNCRQLVDQAQAVCSLATDSSQCELLSNNALDLVEDGFGQVVDESLEVIDEQLTKASLESIGFSPSWWNGSQLGQEHGCQWGQPVPNQYGSVGYPVTCTPWAPDSVFFPDDPPPGCHYWPVGSIGQDAGKVLCSAPPRDLVAIPEPHGQYQPIKVTVGLVRNENPMPEGFQCGPIQAEVTTLTPYGAAGQPYLPAVQPTPTGGGALGLGIHTLTFWLNEPNPHVEIPAEKKPPIPEMFTDLIETVEVNFLGEGSDWRHLLAGGSLVGVKISGQCIPETQGGDAFGIAGIIPEAKPRITPGAAE